MDDVFARSSVRPDISEHPRINTSNNIIGAVRTLLIISEFSLDVIK